VPIIKTKKAGTFSLNKGEAIHRWYSYIEGYSSYLMHQLLDELKDEQIKNIYDPFAGTGTTLLVASQRGINSYYSEVNPFMCEIIEAKTNTVKSIRSDKSKLESLTLFLQQIQNASCQISMEKSTWNGFEKYFDKDVLNQLLQLQKAIQDVTDLEARRILLTALASVLVKASKMIRRGDLRSAKNNEKNDEDFEIYHNFCNKLKEIIKDISSSENEIFCKTTRASFDAKDIEFIDEIDCVITSPPYLNGTNYIRNTKLELKLFDFVVSEKELPAYHSKGIISGINNISKRNNGYYVLPCIEPYVHKLESVAYDKRVPLMVTGYFWDMNAVIAKLAQAMKNDGVFIMDIGDSQFAGIHIPTHDLLSEICASHGFVKYGEEILRQRRSKNGMLLSQRLLKFRLNKNTTPKEVFFLRAQNFINKLPYKKQPYSSRNWGHPWHSLCSYHGKLKPAIAHFLVSNFTNKGDIILDPLCGVGTIPFEACLQGRFGYGNDLSEMAFIVTKAKLEYCEQLEAERALEALSYYIEQERYNSWLDCEKARYAAFGFNGKVADYFHPDTYDEILIARKFYNQKKGHLSSAEAMVFSSLLHVLHGNRPYALSRKSHPLTPYAPKGNFQYKNLIEHVRKKLQISYAKNNYSEYVNGQAILGEYLKISTDIQKVDAIICSPPFIDSIRFYMNNWMRLWMCGWEASDFELADEKFLDVKQRNNIDIYYSFFEICYSILKPNGKIILHLGKTAKIDMAKELSIQAQPFFDEVFRGSENVLELEKHGIKDKGTTIEHQFLFLIKK